MKRNFGQSIFLSPYKGRIHPHYAHPLFIQTISDCHVLLNKQDSEILLDKRNRVGVVNLPLREGESVEIVIKEFRCRGVDKLKSFFLPSKALKAWRGGMALGEKKIETPSPAAYLEMRKGLFLKKSYFLAEKVNQVEEIRFLFLRLPPSELRRLLTSLGSHLSFCHGEGVLHRDLSDGNLLVEKNKEGEFTFYLVDTNRIRIKTRLGLLKRIKNLIRLGVPPPFQRFFLEQYLGKPGVKRPVWFWYRANKWGYTFFVALKKKLRLRKLAQKIKIQ